MLIENSAGYRHIVFNPHGGHSKFGDGTSSPREMVNAALAKKVVPTYLDHSCMHGYQEYLDAMRQHKLEHVAVPGVEWGFRLDFSDPRDKVVKLIQKLPTSPGKKFRPAVYVGEIICLMPPELAQKMSVLVDTWRDKRYFETEPLSTLFDFLSHELTQEEFDALAWHLPHPLYLENTKVGKLFSRSKYGKISRLTPEMWLPEVVAKVHNIETFNASFPESSNRAVYHMIQGTPYAQKGFIGTSDSHDPHWEGSGASLLLIDQTSSEGILEVLKAGRVLPLNGLRNYKKMFLPRLIDTFGEGWSPFFAWVATTKYRRHIPQRILDQIYSSLDVWTPAQQAAELGLLDEGKKFSQPWFEVKKAA